MTIYYDAISEALGLRPIQELVPDYVEDVSIPDDAQYTHKGCLNPFFGKKHDDETREIIKEARRNQKSSGWKWSEDSRRRASESRFGIPKTKESNDKRSKTMSNIPKPIEECPYCGKTGGAPQMRQWHFDKCKRRSAICV